MSSDLKQAHERRIQAIRDADFETLDRYVSDDLIYCSPKGRVQRKPEVFSNFRSGTVKVERMDIRETEFRIFGDTGIVTYTSDYRMVDGGEIFDGRVYSTAVYVKFDEGWKLVCAQQTEVS